MLENFDLLELMLEFLLRYFFSSRYYLLLWTEIVKWFEIDFSQIGVVRRNNIEFSYLFFSCSKKYGSTILQNRNKRRHFYLYFYLENLTKLTKQQFYDEKKKRNYNIKYIIKCLKQSCWNKLKRHLERSWMRHILRDIITFFNLSSIHFIEKKDLKL